MKRLCLALLMTPLMVGVAFAAGSVSETLTKIGSHECLSTYSWTADSSDGSVPSTAGTAFEGWVHQVVTDPGGTAPTDNYDITLTDLDSVDVMGGTLADRDTSNTEQAVPLVGGAYDSRYVQGTLTLNITNNAVNSATGEVKVYIYTEGGARCSR